jgi:hypothetical protein
MSQSIDNLRQRLVPVTTDTLRLDTLSVIPGSVLIQDRAQQIIDYDQYEITPAQSLFYWRQAPDADTVIIHYRVFPYNFTETQQHKDTSMMEQQYGSGYIFHYGKQKGGREGYSDIDWNGSLSRGVSFGNNQDVTVNSNMNLQVSGMVTPEIEIMGAITDKDIPIQPEGNTQQIQDFDQVYLQFRKGNSKLRTGDIELHRPPSYFMNFSKRVMGAKFATEYEVGEQKGMNSQAALSVSKGKYARNKFRGREGNQGPYRLEGNDGESHIIVLANSERVYIDGKLMERGEENDYVIDYNLGEITFTPNQQITEDDRIIVEFEYAVRNYLRTLTHLQQGYTDDKWNVQFNMYAEQDHKNQTQQTLDEKAKQKMRSVGDSLSEAITSGAREDTSYKPDAVQYYRTDTVVDGIRYDSVYVFTETPREDLYQVRFTYVKAGNGNYVIDQGKVTNGRVYKWVAPKNGQPQGSYAPVIQQVTPKKQHMYSLGADYQISNSSQASVELAVSNHDKNTFSDKHEADDKGYASKIGYQKTFDLEPDEKKGWQAQTQVDYEHVNKSFTPLERYRPVEFTRDWNLPNQSGFGEDIARVQTSLQKPQRLKADYAFTAFLRDTAYTGLKNEFHTDFHYQGFDLGGGGSLLESETPQEETQFFRPNLEVSQWLPLFQGVQLGAAGKRERNEITKGPQDTLSHRSFSFDIWEVFAKSSDSVDYPYLIKFRQRRNKHPALQQFRLSNVRNTFSIENSILTNPYSRLRWNVTYREFHVKDSAHSESPPDRGLIGRGEYNGAFWEGVVRLNTLYEIGQGQEQKRQFSYQEVPEGQGYYTWIDRNDDGRKQQDEFEKAFFNDQAKYVRVLLPTNEFQKTHTLKFNQSVNLSPRPLLDQSSSFQQFLGRFSSLSYYRMSRKVLETAQVSRFNPFATDITDTSLISLNTNLKNTLYYNRMGGRFGMDFTWKFSKNKLFLVNGARSKVLQEKKVSMRWNLSESITLRSEVQQGQRNNSSFTPAQNYQIQFEEVAPEISYYYETDFRISLNYKYAFKKNNIRLPELPTGEEKMVSHDVGTEFRYTEWANDDISASFNYVLIGFAPQEQTNSPAAFNMLEGLNPGNNAIWNISWQRQLGEQMEMQLNYEGRTSENTKVIHLGRAEVRYIF